MDHHFCVLTLGAGLPTGKWIHRPTKCTYIATVTYIAYCNQGLQQTVFMPQGIASSDEMSPFFGHLDRQYYCSNPVIDCQPTIAFNRG